MKSRVFPLFLLLLLLLPGSAQDRVYADVNGLQLRATTLEPAMDLLEFLMQGKLTYQERQAIIDESVEEFQTGPEEVLQSMKELSAALQLVQSQNDPSVLGEFRQQMLWEFHQMTQATPANEMPAYLKILNDRAPVVAFDTKTKVALTQQDLVKALLYMQKLAEAKGEDWSDEDVLGAAKEVLETFTQLEPDMQKLLASGTLLETLYSRNMTSMTTQQKSNVTSHYRQTVGGPPQNITTRGPEVERTTDQLLSASGPMESKAMLESLKQAGGDTDYWSAVKK